MLIVTYNIRRGKGRDGRIDLRRIAEALRGADVIALQEVERHWREQEFPDQALRLTELIPGCHWVYGAALDLGGPVRNLRRQFGNMVISRYPIASVRNLPLPVRPVHGRANGQQQMIEAVIDAGPGFRLYTTRLNSLSAGQRAEQLALALGFIAEAPVCGGAFTAPGAAPDSEDDWVVLPNGKLPSMPQAALLVGDLNCDLASTEYRSILSRGFVDALAQPGFAANRGVRPSVGVAEPSQHSSNFFVSSELAPQVKRAWIGETADGSDRQPTWMDLAWP